MRSAVALVGLLACSALHGSALAQATEDETTAESRPPTPAPAPVLPFGELHTWSNGIDSSRVPTELQPLREIGNRALIPPRDSRDPFQARVGAAIEANDNLLLSTDHRRKGTALIASPGVNWIHEGARDRVEVDISAEVLQKIQGDYDGSRLDGSTVQASAVWRTTETTAVNYVGTLLRSHDPAGNTPSVPVLGGAPDQRFSATYQRHEMGVGWRADPRADVSARWIGTWADSRSPNYARTQSNDVELGAHWQYDATARVGVLLRERRAAFDARPGVRYGTGWLEVEHQWSPTLIAQAAVGTGEGDGPSLVLWRASVTKTFAFGQWDAGLERDVIVPAGLGRLYELRAARIAAVCRVGQRGRLEASLLASEYRPLDGTAGALGSVLTLRPQAAYTYAVDSRRWLSLRYLGIDDRVIDSALQRQGDRLLVTLLQTF